MKIRMIIAVVALAVMVSYAEAVERPVYPCHRLTQAPVIDGKLDDEAWKNIPEATGFHILGDLEKYAVEKQTFFKAGWTDDAIYLAVRAEETAPEKMTAKAKDGGNVWEDDSIELFFVPVGAPDYTQLIVNSIGSRCNFRGTYPMNLMDWEAKAVVGKKEWLLEARIPFSVVLGKTPKTDEKWPVNVARNIFSGPGTERFTCWPFLVGAFNNVPNYGCFVFKDGAGDKVIAEENEINRAYILHMQQGLEIKKLADMAKKYERALVDARKSEDRPGETEELLKIWAKVKKMSVQPDADYREMMSVRSICFNLDRRSDDCIARNIRKMLLEE